MAKEGFYNWFKDEVKEELNYALSKGMDLALGDKKQKIFTLYPAYYQKRLFEETRKLVWATWSLAMATIILSGLTLYFQYFNK